MSRQRFVQGVAAEMSWQPIGSDGETATVDPGTVTVGVTRSDGTVVIAPLTATSGTGTDPRTVALSIAQTALLDVLTATWTVAGVVVATTYAEVVGGFYFSTTDLRAAEPSLSDLSTYSPAALIAARLEVETSFESWINLALVPRLTVVDIDRPSGCRLLTGKFFLRKVRWIRRWTSLTDYTDMTDVDDFPASEPGFIDYSGGWYGTRVQAGIEHGLDAPPTDVRRVAMRYARKCAQRATSGLSDRAQSYTTPDGMNVNLGRVGTAWRPTGDEVIDEVLRRPDIDHRMPGMA